MNITKTAIVTGASGFVGSAVCRELISQGTNVIAVVRNNNSNVSRIVNLPGIRIIYCDLKDISSLPDLIENQKIDAFYHFAWEGTSGTLRSDLEVQENNVIFSCAAIKACEKMDCHRFIFSGSIMEYEIEAMMREDIAFGITSLYSSAKLSADFYLKALAEKHQIDYIRAVISNIYGPGETSPRLINTSLRNMINGKHCAFSAGNQMYDFIYISDAAKAFVAIGNRGVSNRTYYIGSQNPRPLKEFLIEMKNAVDPAIKIGLGEMPFNGVALTYREFDLEAVKKDTGFMPEISFVDGIKKTINWIKKED